MEQTTYKITITGVVQGVGFRPFVYKLATTHALEGTVSNDAFGVTIMITTDEKTEEAFVEALRIEAPPLSRIDTIMIEEVTLEIFDGFSIVESVGGGEKTTLIPPDISICQECEAELFDPQNRRYLYPFITCTNCGVRYSIIKALPYDRAYTSMADFQMCKVCEAEYTNPLDRRYHAQPIGCHDCGPKITLDIDTVVRCIEGGGIVAVKGVGGYHLVCDASNDSAVKKMRMRKKRPTKPYAVMVRDIKEAKKYAFISEVEEAFLTSKERPIVLLDMKNDAPLSSQVAPKLSRIGIFLPYTPLHLLLLDRLQRPLVATSANVTDEPICTDMKSLEKLQGVYDMVLDHDREIVNGCDDSVMMVVEDMPIMIRRARGYAPASVKLPFALEEKVLALGANQKSTVAIGLGSEAILSPHIGDLESIESVGYFEKNIKTLLRLYDFDPDVVVHDKHPHYESTKYAKRHYERREAVQHHYAHILGVMAEKGIKEKVLGVAFDGTGYGDDGHLWGGEFLVCDYAGYERVGHVRYFKLLGGAKAIKEPKRVALSLLFDVYGEAAMSLQSPTIEAFSKSALQAHFAAWKKGLQAPFSSSVGRLFDAVASLVGLCQEMHFEGESGMLLEELYDASVTENYPIAYHDTQLDFSMMIEEIVEECDRSVAVSKFFNTVVAAIMIVKKQYDLPLVLSGGVFQNRVLVRLIMTKIPEAVFPSLIPPNDGGIALGQLAYKGREVTKTNK